MIRLDPNFNFLKDKIEDKYKQWISDICFLGEEYLSGKKIIFL